jgi:hypothetical protein
VQGSGRGQIEVLSWNLPGRTKENYDNPQSLHVQDVMNNELEIMCKEVVVAKSMYHPGRTKENYDNPQSLHIQDVTTNPSDWSEKINM